MADYLFYTDGSGAFKEQAGGWAYVQLQPEYREQSGHAELSTNNRMEISAVLNALRSVKEDAEKVTIVTDSQYVLNAITKWMPGWKANNWITASGKDVKNIDLWIEVDKEINKFDYELEMLWTKGHTGNVYNEKADELANKARKDYLTAIQENGDSYDR